MLSVGQSSGPLTIHEEELRLPPWERSLCHILRTGGMWEVVWLFRKIHLVDPLEEGMATHSRALAWRIPWTEKPGGLQRGGPRGSRGVHRIAKNWTRLSDLARTHTRTPCWMDLARRSLMNTLQSTIIPWTPRFSQELAQDPDLCFCGAYTWSDPLPDSFQMGRLLSPHLFFHRRGANGLRGIKSPLKVIAKHWKQSPCSRTDTD